MSKTLQSAKFFCVLFILYSVLAPTAIASVSYPPPTTWKGITYSPRRHTFFRMLYDWNSYDSTSGKYVHQMVDDDMAKLSQNGFNLLHIYIWDTELLQSVNALEPSGFVTAPGDPSTSSNSQWSNLSSFVGKANSNGLYVAIHFANGRVLSRLANTSDTPAAIASEFANWANAFVDYLVPAHSNILLWGVSFALGPAPGSPSNRYSQTWAKCYKAVDDRVKYHRPASAGISGLIGANLTFEVLDGTSPLNNSMVIDRGTAYIWDWQTAQIRVKTMRDALTAEYGTNKDPDIYMLQLYNANSWDLRTGLQSLLSSSTLNGVQPALSKLFVVEFGTSSSLSSSMVGATNDSTANDIPSWGDWQTPTTSAQGQAQWLNNTLCTFSSVGLTKMAYWSLYDPYTMWQTYPWSQTGLTLSWNGYWGLSYENESLGDKSSWNTLKNFYVSNTLSCPGTSSNATPIVKTLLTSNYYTEAQPLRVYWNVADTSNLAITGTYGNSYSCLASQSAPLSTSSLVGSCGYTDLAPGYSAGSRTVQLTAYNASGSSQSSAATVTIGIAPQLNAITNTSYLGSIHANDVAIFWGNGLSISGGNTVQFVRAGYPDVWLYDGDGYFYYNTSHFQINSDLGGRVAPGTWTVYLRSPYSGTPSAAYTLTVLP